MIRSAVGVPSYCSSTAYDQFFNAVIDLHSTEALLRAACAVSLHAFDDHHFSDVDAELDRLAASVRRHAQSNATVNLMASLHHILFEAEGFVGSSSTAPIFRYLPQVLALKLGSSEALCLIYSAVAERLGLDAETIALGRGYCVRVRQGETHHYVDPFRARGMSCEEVAAEISNSRVPGVVSREAWLRAMLRSLQTSLANADHRDDLEAMLELQELLSLISC
jgi:regulator of sirC expression with transglutaminase-like and TPR domain